MSIGFAKISVKYCDITYRIWFAKDLSYIFGLPKISFIYVVSQNVC